MADAVVPLPKLMFTGKPVPETLMLTVVHSLI